MTKTNCIYLSTNKNHPHRAIGGDKLFYKVSNYLILEVDITSVMNTILEREDGYQEMGGDVILHKLNHILFLLEKKMEILCIEIKYHCK